MNKEQQIEELYGVIDLWANNAVRINEYDGASVYNPYNAKSLAEALYDAGYRKEDEVRKEAYKEVLNKVKGLLEGYVDTRDNKNLYIKLCENFGIEVEE